MNANEPKTSAPGDRCPDNYGEALQWIIHADPARKGSVTDRAVLAALNAIAHGLLAVADAINDARGAR